MSATIEFGSTLAAALRGRGHHCLVATRAALAGGLAGKVLGGRAEALLAAMLADASPGGLGRLVTTFTGREQPARLSVGVLPDRVSRHTTPTRAHALQEVLGKLDLARGKSAVVVQLDDPAHYVAAAVALARALPLFDRRRGARKRKTPPRVTLVAVDRKGAAIRPPAGVRSTLDAVRWAADLVDRPTSELDPAHFVAEARRALRGRRGVKVRTLVGEELAARGLGGVYAVGRAAAVPPRLLVLEHAPRRAKRTIALVGKGVVYDTGGLNLKQGPGMSGMKGDMGGGAAVVGAFRVLVEGGCPDRLLCLVPLAENAIGPHSYRPDDILTLHSGKTVEINNTDAEGRLLLADAVSFAARSYEPDLIVDAATLTGAQLVSTGKRHAAVVSNRQGVEDLAVRAGRASGDMVHPLPFAPELFQREFKSEVADMLNSVKDRMNAQSSCAAQFIHSHIEDLDVPWLHVDLAGPAVAGRRGTGYGVALIAELVRQLKAADLAE